MLQSLKEIELKSMPFMAPFMGITPRFSKEDKFKRLDYNKVKEIINSNNDIIKIVGGLAEDWDCTRFEIYNNIDEKIKDCKGTTGYDLSKWATPAIQIIRENSIKNYECWLWDEV